MTVLGGPDARLRWTDEFASRLVLACVSSLPPDQSAAIFDRRAQGTGIEVTVTVNGHDFSIDVVATRLYEQYDRMVLERAGELLKEKFGDLTWKLDDTVNQLILGMRAQAVKDLGYNPWGDE